MTTTNTNQTPLAPNVSVAEATALSKVAFGAGRMFHITGQGGGGKTSIFTTVIAEANGISPANVRVVNLSGMGPQELLGYGIPDSESRDLWFSCPEIWPTQARVGSDKVLLVLDEFSEWDPAARSLCRSLFQPVAGDAPRIGTHVLGSNVMIGLTSNRRGDGTRSAVIEAPIVERCMTVTLQPKLDEFLTWAVGQGVHTTPVYAFLHFTQGNGGQDHFNPKVPVPWNGAPHPCPRAWEATMRATLNQDLLDNPVLLGLALQGFVGQAAGLACQGFCQLVGNIVTTVEGIKAGTETMPLDPSNQYAALYAGIRMVRREIADDPEAGVAAGKADWLANKMILSNNVGGELRTWAYTTATSNEIPLQQHANRAAMQGIGATQ